MFKKDLYGRRQPKTRSSLESGSDGESRDESSDEDGMWSPISCCYDYIIPESILADNDSLFGSYDDEGAGEATEAEMEKLLLEHLSDSDRERDEPQNKKHK